MKKFNKITEDMLEDEKFFVEKNVVDIVADTLYNNYSNYEFILQRSLIDCESPIEQLLAINLERINLLGMVVNNPFVDVIAIDKQQEIKCNKKATYRVDFLITVEYKNQEIKGFVIECDGHEFHQKTKEQVEKDNERTRNLQKAGFEVIRFSGTEIWHRGYRCACEVRNIILSKCKYIRDGE